MILLFLLVSCMPSNVVNGVPVRFVTPAKVLSLDCDSSFTFDFPEVECLGGLQLVSDSVLFVSDSPYRNEQTYFYKAYSLSDLSYLGGHLAYGRGPGEFLLPELLGHCKSKETVSTCDYIADIVQMRSFAYDFSASVSTGKDVVYPVSMLPSGTIYAYPFRDSLQLIVNTDNDRIMINLTDDEGAVLKSKELYPDVGTERNFPQLCFAEAINNDSGVLAMFMLSLPQINFLDIETGEIRTFAVDKAYRNWDSIINVFDVESVMNSPIYYSIAMCTSDHIIASYRSGITHNGMKNGDACGTHLHIFNWDGDFLYDVSLNETISSPVYDSARKHLYAIDYSHERIYRYDLSGII